MFDFMKHRPKPPAPPHDCVENIQAWRSYVLAELDTHYKKILEGLSVADGESLARLHEIIHEFNEIEARIDSALNLMNAEIQAVRDLLQGSQISMKIVAEYNPVKKDLTFRMEGESNE